MDRPLRLITAGPVDRVAMTLEALLVVASQPLSVEELAAAANDDPERIETALALLGERFAEGRSGIVLGGVAGAAAAARRSRRGDGPDPRAARVGRRVPRRVDPEATNLLPTASVTRKDARVGNAVRRKCDFGGSR